MHVWLSSPLASHSFHCASSPSLRRRHTRTTGGALGRIRLPKPRLITTPSPPRPTRQRPPSPSFRQLEQRARRKARCPSERGLLQPDSRPRATSLSFGFRYRGPWRGTSEGSLRSAISAAATEGSGAVRKGPAASACRSACWASYIRLARRRPDHGNTLAPFTSLRTSDLAHKNESAVRRPKRFALGPRQHKKHSRRKATHRQIKHRHQPRASDRPTHSGTDSAA